MMRLIHRCHSGDSGELVLTLIEISSTRAHDTRIRRHSPSSYTSIYDTQSHSMPSYSNRVPFSLYPSAPSDAIRSPFESKNRPPPTICGTPVATLLTASGNVRNSMELFVPLTARIFGHRSAATTSGSSARTLKNRLATGLAPCEG